MPPPLRRTPGGRYAAAGEEEEVEHTETTAAGRDAGDLQEEIPTLSRGPALPSSPSLTTGAGTRSTAPGEPVFDSPSTFNPPDPQDAPEFSLAGASLGSAADDLDQVDPTRSIPRRQLRPAPPPAEDSQEISEGSVGDEDDYLPPARSPVLMGILTFLVVLGLGLAAFWWLRPMLLGTGDPSAPEPISDAYVNRPEPTLPPPRSNPAGAPPEGSGPATPSPDAKAEAPATAPEPTMAPEREPSRPSTLQVVFRGPRGMAVKHEGRLVKLDAPYTVQPGPFVFAYQCPKSRWANGRLQLEIPNDSEPLVLTPCKSKR
jgi:hypothetical protein